MLEKTPSGALQILLFEYYFVLYNYIITLSKIIFSYIFLYFNLAKTDDVDIWYLVVLGLTPVFYFICALYSCSVQFLIE